MTLDEIAFERACLKFMESVYVERFRLLRKNKDYKALPPCMKSSRFIESLEMIDELPLQDIRVQMLTITPRHSALDSWKPLEMLIDFITSRKNLLISPEWCYEQKSENKDNPYGYHVHIAFYSSQRQSEIIRRVFADLKKVFDDPEENWIDINTNSPVAYNYVHGQKKLEKENKLKVDEIIRKKYNLDTVYKKEKEWFTRKELSPDMETLVSQEPQQLKLPLRHSI